jgi:hypothetical protein
MANDWHTQAMDEIEEPVADEQPQDILAEARDIIRGPRMAHYGHPRINLQTIAELWTTYLKRRFPNGVTQLEAQDVCVLMILLKTGRLTSGVYHRDTPLDIAGYAGLIEVVQEDGVEGF